MKEKTIYRILPFFISLSLLAYEILFIRIFSYIEWQNYVVMIISLSLAGIGISGTILTLIKKKVTSDIKSSLFWALVIYAFSLYAGFLLYSIIPFNPFEMSWNSSQIIYFILHLLVLLVPFTIGPMVTGILFWCDIPIYHVYFSNLIGSSAGTLLALCLLFFLHPLTALMVILLIVTLLAGFVIPSLISPLLSSFKRWSVVILIFVLPFIFYTAVKNGNLVSPSPYKEISYTRHLPDAKILAETYSPLGIVTVMEAKGLRDVKGLSYLYNGTIPEQKAIFIDGHSAGMITPFKEDLSFVRHTTHALPFELFSVSYDLKTVIKNKAINSNPTLDEKPLSLLIVGTGGGEGILRGLSYKIKNITGIERDPRIIELMREPFADYSGNIYHHKSVSVVNQDARHFIQRTREKYDIIEISLAGSFNTAAAGIYAYRENYLFTMEGLNAFYSCLTDQGMLSITGWINTPPRSGLKLFHMLRILLSRQIKKDISPYMTAIRSSNTLTLLISKRPIDKALVRGFCQKNAFDLIFLDQLKKEESHRYFKVKNPILYEGMKALTLKDAGKFIRNYPFNLDAATDDRPFFGHFFTLKTYLSMKRDKIGVIPVNEWGLFLYFIILVPLVLISLIFIFLPLLLLKKKEAGESVVKPFGFGHPFVHLVCRWNGLLGRGTASRALEFKRLLSCGRNDDQSQPIKKETNHNPLWIFLYFFSIGTAYFYIEIPLIQKFSLFLPSPTHAVTIIIATLLFFSGLGSYIAQKIPLLIRPHVFSAIAIIVMLMLVGLTGLTPLLLKCSVLPSIILIVTAIAIPAFFMGMPFPMALSLIKSKDDQWVAWAFGINGFASIIAILSAPLIAVKIGFSAVLFFSICLYCFAGWIYSKL